MQKTVETYMITTTINVYVRLTYTLFPTLWNPFN